jgi:hypothetical protein
MMEFLKQPPALPSGDCRAVLRRPRAPGCRSDGCSRVIRLSARAFDGLRRSLCKRKETAEATGSRSDYGSPAPGLWVRPDGGQSGD